MGAGIAQVAACAGYSVVMIDIEQEYVDKGLSNIEKSPFQDSLEGKNV